MMKRLFMILAVLALMVSSAWATAWTENATKFGVVTAKPADGTTSYVCSKTAIYLTGIEFFPTQANDVLVVRHGSATGPEIAMFKSIDGGPQFIPFAGYVAYSPYILYTDNTLGGTATNARVIFHYIGAP